MFPGSVCLVTVLHYVSPEVPPPLRGCLEANEASLDSRMLAFACRRPCAREQLVFELISWEPSRTPLPSSLLKGVDFDQAPRLVKVCVWSRTSWKWCGSVRWEVGACLIALSGTG